MQNLQLERNETILAHLVLINKLWPEKSLIYCEIASFLNFNTFRGKKSSIYELHTLTEYIISNLYFYPMELVYGRQGPPFTSEHWERITFPGPCLQEMWVYTFT